MNVQDHLWYPYLRYQEECRKAGKEDSVQEFLVITGKGLRSKAYKNPYVSEELSFLRYSVPEFIKNDENLKSKISKISKAKIKDGGEGAIYIFLKNN